MSTNIQTVPHTVNPNPGLDLTKSYATPTRSELTEQAQQFRELRAHLHHGAEWAYLHLIHPTETYTAKDGSEKPRSQSLWYPADQPLAIPAYARDWHVYFGVHGAARKGERWQRTAIKDGKSSPRVSVINALFGDFDFKDFDGKSATMQHILSLPVFPSALVETGGGYHAYWLLDEPFYLDSDEAAAAAKSLQYRWAEFVGSDPGAKDQTRVLRAPGTINHKTKYAPDFPTVRFVSARIGNAYPLAELEVLLPPPPEPKPKRVYDQLPSGEIERALSHCTNVDGYDAKLKILMALHSEFGDGGIGLAEKYIDWHPDNGETIANKFAGFSDDGLVGIGTLFYYAAQHGYERSEDVSSFVPSEQYQTRQQFEQLITQTRADIHTIRMRDYVPVEHHSNHKHGKCYRTESTDFKLMNAILDICNEQGSTTITTGSRELTKRICGGVHQTVLNALPRLAGWFIEFVVEKGKPTQITLIWDLFSPVDSIALEETEQLSTGENHGTFNRLKATDPFLTGRSRTAKRLKNEIKPLGYSAGRVIHALMDCNGQTRAELAEATGRPLSAVYEAVRRLRYFGLVEESEGETLRDAKFVWLESDWLDVLGAFVPQMTTYKLSLEREDRHLRAQVAYCDELLNRPDILPFEQTRIVRRKRRLMAERIAVLEQLHEDWTDEQIERFAEESQAAAADKRHITRAAAQRERENRKSDMFEQWLMIQEARQIMAAEDAVKDAMLGPEPTEPSTYQAVLI